jgi:hypothetical protein
MTERLAMPSDPAAGPVPDTLETLDRRDMHEDRPWEGAYLAEPYAARIGIACSGGGIRSASYCLGALQVLSRASLLGETEHLACVSGGGYISIARAVMIDQTLKQAKADGVEPTGFALRRISRLGTGVARGAAPTQQPRLPGAPASPGSYGR